MSEEKQNGAEGAERQAEAPKAPEPPTENPPKPADEAGRETPDDARAETVDEPRAGGLNLAAILSALSLVLVMVLAGAVYWMWQSRQQLSGSLQARAEAGEQRLTELAADLSRQSKQLNDGLQAMRATLAAQAKSLAELERRRGREQGEWDIAEVEYFLKLAQRRLAWVNDVGSALAALRVADRRLQVLNDTRLVPVRQAIAAELRALEALPQADLAALAQRLAKLQREIGGLPMKPVARGNTKNKVENTADTPRPALTDWRAHLSSLRQVFTDLVTVRRIDTPARPLLSPEQMYFLRENLSLKLETARLALLRGDARLYKESIATARTWLDEYFNPGAPEVEQLARALDELAAARLIESVPDISASLATLQRLTGREARP